MERGLSHNHWDWERAYTSSGHASRMTRPRSVRFGTDMGPVSTLQATVNEHRQFMCSNRLAKHLGKRVSVKRLARASDDDDWYVAGFFLGTYLLRHGQAPDTGQQQIQYDKVWEWALLDELKCFETITCDLHGVAQQFKL